MFTLQAHLACTKGITHADMDNLEAELSRLKKLKAEKLNDMLEDARDKIFGLLEVSSRVSVLMLCLLSLTKAVPCRKRRRRERGMVLFQVALLFDVVLCMVLLVIVVL